MEKLKLENQLCFKLYALSRQIINIYRPVLEEVGITYPQYLVMLVLWETKRISVKHLGERLYLDSGTLTPLLKRLEQKNIITRRRDPADERSVLIELTNKGTAMEEKATCIPDALISSMQLDVEEYEQTKHVLDHLLTQLH